MNTSETTKPQLTDLSAAGLDLLPTPTLIVDRETLDICVANKSAQSLLGEARLDAPVVGAGLAQFTDLPYEVLKQELRLAASSGHIRLRLGLAAKENGPRQRVQVVALRHDSTGYWVLSVEKRDAERAKFTALNEQLLESNLRARALATSNRKLKEMQDELRRVNTDLDYFTHIAAHDLQAPCRRQILLAEMLGTAHRDDISEPMREGLDSIAGQGRNMLNMIAGFRMLSDMAGPAIDKTTISLQDLATEVASDLLDPESGDRVVVDLPTEVEGYEDLLRILFQNLIINALRHGSSPLDLKLTAVQRDQQWVYTASNSEPADKVDKQDLLQPFVRGRTEAEGSGLGLSICKRVVDRHQGEVSINHEEGRFVVRFTLGTGDENVGVAVAGPVSQLPVSPRDGQR